PSKTQPRLAAISVFHWVRLRERYQGGEAAAISVMALLQNLERQRFETEVVAGVEQDRTVGHGDDLRHQRAHEDVIARLALRYADLPFAVGIVRDRHEDIEARIDVEARSIHAVAANGCLQVRLAVRGALCRLAVARDVEVLAAKSAAAIVLLREVFLDLPHLPGTVAVERVRRGEFPAQVHGAARMHAQQLAHVIAIERDEVRDLLSLRLGEAQPLTSFDLEADVAARRNRGRNPRLQHRARTTHANRLLPVVCSPRASKVFCDHWPLYRVMPVPVRCPAILRAAAGSRAQTPGPRSPAGRSRARGRAPGTRTRARRPPPRVPAEAARRNVPDGRTVRMHRQFGALDPRGFPRDRALARARTRPLSTSEDSTHWDRGERVDRVRRSFAPIGCPPRRLRGRA